MVDLFKTVTKNIYNKKFLKKCFIALIVTF